MFEGAIAAFLNRFLGRYVEDLDTERFNIGIFSGDTCLTDLKLKPEALYQLGLPIRVEAGLIGKIILKIPWTGLLSQPVVIHVEDIFIVAVPILYGQYNMELQKKLLRAEKKKILEDLEDDKAFTAGLPLNFFDGIVTSIMRNFQITINNIHIRYEEKLFSSSLSACGICIQSISMTTTNNKWKPGIYSTNSQTLYQLVRAESLSIYMDHDTESSLQNCPSKWDFASFLAWKGTMLKSLQTFGMRNKEFQFLLKPFTAKIKIIIHKGSDVQTSRILIDLVLQDVAMQISEMQYITFCHLYDSLQRATINRPHRKYRPQNKIHENPSSWWKYAYNSVLDQYVKPYVWQNIAKHRKNYKKYKEMYNQILLQPNDTELKLDMQKFEDNLTIVNIVIAREHARQELRNKKIKQSHESSKEDAAIKDEEVVSSNENKSQDKAQSVDQDKRRTFYNLIDNGPNAKINLEKLSRPIDYKYNFTLANFSLSLLSKNKEVLVATVTQFLTSVETAPKLSAFKVSARAESCVIEGVSQEGDLVPLTIVDNVLTGNVSTNFLALDFEKKRKDIDPSFDLSIKLETIEVIYHHYAVMEIINFFKLGNPYIENTLSWSYKLCNNGVKKFLSFIDSITSQEFRITIKIDIGGPYIVFPEHGSIQREGHLMILDFGDISLVNELQATNLQLEDATLMELDVSLYDRLHIEFKGGQILCCHSGDDWRAARKQEDSEYHFVSKMEAKTTISYSIKPEYRQLPRAKLNVTVQRLKINVSENKIQLITYFLNTLSIFCWNYTKKYQTFMEQISPKTKSNIFVLSLKKLKRIQNSICLPTVTKAQKKFDRVMQELLINNVPRLDRSVVSSEISEEDLELLSKAINLYGFDENVSPYNHMNFLIRFAIGELSIHVGYMNETREEPYLNLRLRKVSTEIGIMEYGFAIQFMIDSIILLDQTNADITGSYLEFISTGKCEQVFDLSYRKVRSDCPDFKGVFKNIERLLLIKLLNTNIILHRPALLKVKKFWKNINQIFCGTLLFECMKKLCLEIIEWEKNDHDPPIPPGAIKLNYSARIGTLTVRLCDKDTDLMKIEILGIENDCIYIANERMVFRVYLRNLLVEDLNEETLYAKILTTDEDKVLDLKYVRHTPKLYVCSDIDTNQDDVMSHGTFKLSIGRINCVLITKILQDLHYFLVPFASSFLTQLMIYLKKKCIAYVEEFKRNAIKLHIFIDIQGPTFLLPQKKDIANLIVFDTGILSVENFFKKVDLTTQTVKNHSIDGNHIIMDNILLKLKSMTLSRAIMTLSRDLEVQEPIIEPVYIHFDIKRKTEYHTIMEYETFGLFKMHGSIDFVCINLSQRDLQSIMSVWKENISKVILSQRKCENKRFFMVDKSSESVNTENAMVKKLEVFLAQNEANLCEININLTLDGIQLNLFLDSDEVLSSPVRDLNHGLCKLNFGEIINTFDFYSDNSLQMKFSLQSIILQDTRKDSFIIKKIIQSPAKLIGLNVDSCISVSLSPIVDITYNQAPTGDKCLNILIQETRINLSISFLFHLVRYFLDALPHDQIEGGIINHGYENNSSTYINDITTGSNNVNYELYCKEQPDVAVSVRIQKPEILLFGDLKSNNTHIILFQAEIIIESSSHNCLSSIVCTITNIRAKSTSQGTYLRQSPHWLLRPCDVEICKKEELLNHTMDLVISVSPVYIHLSPGIMHTFVDITNEALGFITNIGLKFEDRTTGNDLNQHTDLWSPKNISSIPYKKVENELLGNIELLHEYNNQDITFCLKPIPVYILIEMETSKEKVPMVRIETVIDINIDCSKNFHLESKLNVHAFCYDIDHKVWEPFIELCTKDGIKYNPWILTIKMYNGESCIIDSNWTDPWQRTNEDTIKKKKNINNNEEDSMDMVFINPEHTVSLQMNGMKIFPGYDEDSDTDDDENGKKLTKSTNYLFSNESSEDEDSDSIDSSTNEDDGLDLPSTSNVESSSPVNDAQIKMGQTTATYIIISTEDVINFTITPSNLAIMNMIIDAFVEVKNGMPIIPTNISEINLQNNIGHASRVELLVQEQVDGKMTTRILTARNYHCDDSPPSTPNTPDAENMSRSTSPQWITNENGLIDFEDNPLNYPLFTQNIIYNESPICLYKMITGEVLHIIIEGFKDISIYCPKRQGCKFIPLRPVKQNVEYYLIVDTTIDKNLQRTISIRSPLQIRNETSYALALYYKKQLAETLQLADIGEAINPFDDNIRMGIIEPDCIYNVPLYIAYHFPIYVEPAYLENYQISEEGIFWKELNIITDTSKDVFCKLKNNENQSVFCIKVVGTEFPMAIPQDCRVPNYLINIIPPLILNNQLPFVIDIGIPSINYEVKIEPGDKVNVHSLMCTGDIQFHFKIQNYLGAQWSGTIKVNMNLERKFVLMSTDNESYLGKPFIIHVELCKSKSWYIIIHAQYWIVNKTGLPLFIQECHLNLSYEIPEEELLVLSQKNNKKDTIRLRAHQSEWSLPFILNGINSMSLIVCKDIERGRKYRILAEIDNSRLSPLFTKIIIFLPYFFVHNKTKKALRFMEENDNADLWNDLLPGQEIPFWPVTESLQMRVKWKHSQLDSQHFNITQTGKTVLRMDNGSALCIEIEGGANTPYYIVFRKYMIGDVPVRVDNLCSELFLKINQINSGQVTLLNPFQSILYTWDDPSMPRELMWNIYNNKKSSYKARFDTDGFEQEVVPFITVECRDGCTVSTAKSLLHTRLSYSQEKINISTNDNKNDNSETEQSRLGQVRKDKITIYWVSYMEGTQRILLFTEDENIFLKARSIIEPEISKREIFLSVAGVGVSVILKCNEKSKEFLYGSISDSSACWELCFGKKWKTLSLELSAWLENKYINSFKRTQLDNFIDVDLEKMHMTKPFFGKLRRTYSPGIWIHCRQSITMTYMQSYIHRIQIDNQLNNVTFPVILHCNLEKSMTNFMGNHKSKHCLEFILLKQKKLHKTIYKGISVILRIFNINLQEEVALSLVNLIPKTTETKYSIAAKLRKDVSNVHIHTHHKNIDTLRRNKTAIIEYMYISPIVISLKLLANTEGPKIYNSSDLTDYHNIIKYIFEYAENGSFEKHAEFKFPCYEKYFTTTSIKHLLLEISRNYTVQFMQQYQVLIHSITVLGNQYGYNFRSPNSNFYDPDSILICGEEISVKLSHDIACLLGHATADSVIPSFINLNNCESHNQRSKEKELYFHSIDISPAKFLINNFFSTDIELELSGLISLSTNNLQREELKYYLRTLGKKLSAFFKIENASSAETCPKIIENIIKRIQEMGCKFISRIRLPRFISPYMGVELYSTHKAKGMHLLELINKDYHRRMDDTYWAHSILSNDGKQIALISLQRVYLVEKAAAWGLWNIKWSIDIKQLSPPTVVVDKLVLHVNKNEQASTAVVDWYLESKELEVLEWLCRKINTAITLNMESSICSKQDV
ncbi:PREDICTED: vacuolar protein sorting-associated protein 13C-like [Polistes canadensis]|uniref:vacuolar protein sorting-associated protein 13C-like n=1 Tax=Polistes canadensis TaxID=91411 RepID=UPI000718CFEA|nr:PREDICTED: vacuolar protein sorting-associated protein 13C-like [Polistes canadensis]